MIGGTGMMGRNHLIAGTAIAVAAVSWVKELRDPVSGAAQLLDGKLSWLLHLWPGWLGGFGGPDSTTASPEWAVLPVSGLAADLSAWAVPVELASVWGAMYALLAVALFWVGSLLPDIDSKDSLLGRHLYIPGPHHGITHTDWFLGVLLLISLPGFTRVLIWLWLGAVVHCWMDGLSSSGRARFYPFGRHKTVSLPNGGGACVMAGGKRLILYSVGEMSETVVLAGILGLSAASVLLVLGA